MIGKLILNNCLHKPLNAVLSIILFTLGVGISSLIILVEFQLKQKLNYDLVDIDMIVGAKGSPLQMVLSTIFQVDHPTGNIPVKEIEKLSKLQGAELNEAKKILATEATKLARGENAAHTAAQTAQNAFVMGGTDGLPTIILPKADFKNGYSILDLLVLTELAPTKSEARRLIKGGGIKLNDENVSDDTQKITISNFDKGIIKLSVGKKKHHLIEITE